MLAHHAYYCEGDASLFPALIQAAREAAELTDAGNPDVFEKWHDSFGINESRELANLASLRGVGTRSLFILGASSMTIEAQQALLKLFEEPREGVIFVLLIPHGALIPTLRSRMLPFPQRLTLSKEESGAKKFLAASVKERSEMLAKILKGDSAREELRKMLNGMEALLYKSKGAERLAALREIAAMRPYLGDRSPSLKMIFEHLAAALPKV